MNNSKYHHFDDKKTNIIRVVSKLKVESQKTHKDLAKNVKLKRISFRKD